MRVIPAVDLKAGRTVRLVEGAADRETCYDVDPVETALGFERAGAPAIHLVDLDGAFVGRGEANAEVIAAILAAVRVPVELGGGLRSAAAVEAALAAGATWAIVGTMAVEEPELLRALVSALGSRIVVGVDARDGVVATRGWTASNGVAATTFVRELVSLGVERVIYTDIGRDGTLQGPNIEATVAVARDAGIRVTASGGIASLDDIRALAAHAGDGIEGCVVGKALYEGRFSLREALAASATTT